MNQVSKQGIPGKRLPAGIGYVYIPKDIDVNKFKMSCYRNGTVSFITENGERFDNVKVSKSVIKDLEFPVSTDVLGSEIFWVLTPKYKQPVILGVFLKSGEYINLSEGEFVLSKKTDKGYVEISGSVDKNCNLILKLDSEVSDSKILIHSVSKDGTGQIELTSDGDCSIVSGGKVKVQSSVSLEVDVTDYENSPGDQVLLSLSKDLGLSYTDYFGNRITVDKDGLISLIPAKKFFIGEGEEPLVKGLTLKTELDKEKSVLTLLLNAINNAPIVPGDGGAAFKASLVAAISTAVRGSFEDINSEIGFTD